MSLPIKPPRPFQPIPLTYAEEQGRLCAEEAFMNATQTLLTGSLGDLTYDDFLRVWGDVIDLLRVKAEVGKEMLLFSPGERLLWLNEAIETVIEKARLQFLSSIRHIEVRGEFAPGMHENIALVRFFLLSPEMRASESFDSIVAA